MVQNHSLTVFAKFLFWWDENVSQNKAAVEAMCSVCWGQQNVCFLLISSYGWYVLLPLQCLPVYAQFWQNLCRSMHSFDRTFAGVCTVLTEALPEYAQFWQNLCRCMHSFDRTFAGVCTVLTEPLPVYAQFWQNRQVPYLARKLWFRTSLTQLLIVMKSGNSAYFRGPNFRCVILLFFNGFVFNAQWGSEHWFTCSQLKALAHLL
jgi:hypothetical protein